MNLDGRTIYVPVADSYLRRSILPGSGIVGTPAPETKRILIDYEGNKYGSPQFRNYEERVRHAYGRHVWNGRGYPTVARQLVPAEQLLEVGFLTVTDPSDADVVAELQRRYPHFDRRFLARMSPEFRATKKELARPQVHIDRQDVVDEWCATPVVALRVLEGSDEP